MAWLLLLIGIALFPVTPIIALILFAGAYFCLVARTKAQLAATLHDDPPAHRTWTVTGLLTVLFVIGVVVWAIAMALPQ